MGKTNYTGLKQGMLTVLGEGSKKYYWLCKCECGNTKEISSFALKRGQVSCGCMRGSNFKGVPSHDNSHIGERYGLLTIIAFVGTTDGYGNGGKEALWECRCDCGKTVVKKMRNLRKGSCPSCGCFTSQNGHKPFRFEEGNKVKTQYSNFLIQSKFRKLKKNSRSHEKYYVCECLKCHEKTIILENVLAKGRGSCYACSNSRSFPAKFIYWFLKQLNVEFETEYSPEWSGRCRYDFSFLYEGKRYIIEADGLDHYSERTRNDKTFSEIKETDKFKDEMAHSHDCSVIRIDCRYSNKDYIVNSIMNSPLNSMFDLPNIDWDYCVDAWRKLE